MAGPIFTITNLSHILIRVALKVLRFEGTFIMLKLVSDLQGPTVQHLFSFME